MTCYLVELDGLAGPVVVWMRSAIGRRVRATGEALEVGRVPKSLFRSPDGRRRG